MTGMCSRPVTGSSSVLRARMLHLPPSTYYMTLNRIPACPFLREPSEMVLDDIQLTQKSRTADTSGQIFVSPAGGRQMPWDYITNGSICR